MKEYAARWEASMQGHWKPKTREIYVSTLHAHIVKHFGDQRFRDLTTPGILHWAQRKLDRHSRATIKLHLHVLRLVCRRAVVEGLFTGTPVDAVFKELGLKTDTVAPNAGEEEQVKALTPEQLGTFLATAERVAPLFAPLWRVQAMTGLRPGEAAGLHVADVADETGAVQEELSVRRTVSSSGKQAGTPKTKSSRRTVELTKSLRSFLAAYLNENGLRFTPAAPLFPPERRGTGYHPAAVVAKAFRRVVHAAGLPEHLTPHALRHTFASIHLAFGTGDVYWVARQLGHKDIRMTTAIYGRWLKARRPEALERFDAALAAAAPRSEVAAA